MKRPGPVPGAVAGVATFVLLLGAVRAPGTGLWATKAILIQER